MKTFKDGGCLGYEAFQGRGIIFVNCFDLEMVKAGPTAGERVLAFYSKAYLNMKLHTLFTEEGLQTYQDEIFMNIEISEFTMSLADRFAIMAGLGDIDDLQVERTIATGIDQAFEQSSAEVKDRVPPQISSNLQRDGNAIFELLRANRWLVVLVFTCLFFDKTATFEPIQQAPTRRSKTQPQADGLSGQST